MAVSYSIGGASNINLFGFQSKVEFSSSSLAIPYKTTCTGLQSPYWLKGIQTKHEIAAAVYNKKPCHLRNFFVASCALSSMKNGLDVDSEEEKSTVKHISPCSPEVESLLTTICDTTSIAEFKMKIAGFQLYVKRNLVENNVPPPAPSLPAIQTSTSDLTQTNGSATTSLAITKPKASEGMQKILDTASDEGLVILKSPKVGFFRRCRTIKGKKAPPSCKEKQQVKEGKVLCYIEQLGGEIPIESDVSGEVVKILRRDGEPIGYGDALISILPSFPGIKKLQ